MDHKAGTLSEAVVEVKPEETHKQFLNTEYDEQTIRTFIGDSADYYMGKWTKVQEPDKKASFNWPALLFPMAWFAYRKMFRNMFLYIIMMNIGIILPDLLLGEVMGADIALIIFARCLIALSLRLFIAVYSNALYFRHTVKKLKKLDVVKFDPQRYKEQVKKDGGISELGVLLALLIPFISKYILGVQLIGN